MTPRIVATHRIFPETAALLDRAGTVDAPAAARFSPAELEKALATASAAMVFMPDRVDARFLDGAPKLTIVGAALKGYDNIDVGLCTKRGVWVSIVPDLLTIATAELAIGLIIGLARHIRDADGHVRSGNFAGWEPRFYGRGLQQATVGLVGFGAIGRAIAQRLRAFESRLIYFDERPHSPQAEVLGVARRSLPAWLMESDIVVLGLPLGPTTLHLIDASRLLLMRPGALLVNPARGSLVDEVAVAESLRSGHLGGYAADAFELEDLSRDDRPRQIAPELLQAPRTLFTAHIGSATTAARMAIEARAAQNIVDALSGARPRDAINSVS